MIDLLRRLENAAGGDGGAGGGGAAGGAGAGGGAGGAGGGAGGAGAAGGGDGKGGAGGAGGDGKGGAAGDDKSKEVAYTFEKVKRTAKDAAGKETVTEFDVPEAIAKEISDYAKANGFTKEQAQALMNRELKLIEESAAADKDAQAKGLAALKKKWNDETKADPTFGGEGGAKFDENMGIAKRALNKFFPDVAKEADKHPFLDHPQVLKGLLQIGQLISPDGEFISGRGSSVPRDAAKTLYPDMK